MSVLVKPQVIEIAGALHYDRLHDHVVVFTLENLEITTI